MKCEFSQEELFAIALSIADRETIVKNFIPIHKSDRKLITHTLTGLVALRTKINTLIQKAEGMHPIVRELEAQEDLRRELLRFYRFLHAEGYGLVRTTFPGGDNDLLYPHFKEIVERFIETNEIDWFERAQQTGYAQESGRVISEDAALAEISQAHSHEADALITDACYLLNMQDDGTLTEAEVTEWRTRWLQAAGTYLMSIGGAE